MPWPSAFPRNEPAIAGRLPSAQSMNRSENRIFNCLPIAMPAAIPNAIAMALAMGNGRHERLYTAVGEYPGVARRPKTMNAFCLGFILLSIKMALSHPELHAMDGIAIPGFNGHDTARSATSAAGCATAWLSCWLHCPATRHVHAGPGPCAARPVTPPLKAGDP